MPCSLCVPLWHTCVPVRTANGDTEAEVCIFPAVDGGKLIQSERQRTARRVLCELVKQATRLSHLWAVSVGDVKMIAQVHTKSGRDGHVKHGSPKTLVAVPQKRQEWAPVHPVDPRTHQVPGKSHSEWHMKSDRVSGLIAVLLFTAFIGFVAWVISHGPPEGFDPTWSNYY